MHSLHHRWRGDVLTIWRGTRLVLTAPDGTRQALGPLPGEVAAAIVLLDGAGAPLARIRAAAAAGGVEAIAHLEFRLARFRRSRLVEWALRRDGRDIVVFRSLDGGFAPAEGPMPEGRHVLSRFAYLRRDGTDLVLDSAESPCRAILAREGLAAIAAASGDTSVPDADRPALVEALWRMGFTEPAEEPEPAARAMWEFADRVLHMASRRTHDAAVLGGTYRFRGRLPPPPAEKPPIAGATIAFPTPDAAALAARSRPLVVVGEARRSRRAWRAAPVPFAALGELLWRTGRVQERLAGADQELARKPIPAGGGIHELEWYLAAGGVGSLPPALYHYDGGAHALRRLPGSEAASQRLADGAALSLGGADRPPPVLVVLAARLPRLAWKYQGIAYRLTLLHAGIAIEALCLAATDLGLAACPIGSGDQRPFEAATGLSSFEETPVAELALGVAE